MAYTKLLTQSKLDPDKKVLIKNFLSLSVMQGLNYILPLITLPYLVKVLGPEKFGLIAFAQAFIQYFNILTDYGFNLSATRKISLHREDEEKVSEIFSSVMVIKLTLMAISFILLVIIVLSFRKFRDNWEIYFLTFGIVVGQVLFPIWFFQGMERMKYITFLNILAKLIFTIAIFVFIHNASDYIYVPLINSLGFVVAGILALWIVFRDFEINFKIPSVSEIKRELKEGWYIFISNIGISFYRNFNTFILGLFTNNLVVGYYAIAEKILGAIQGLQVPVGQALFPFLSKKFEKFKENQAIKFLFENLKIVLLGYLILFVLSFLFSKPIIKLISGKTIENSVLDFKILSFIIIIGGLNYYFGILGLVTLGYSRRFMKLTLIAGIFNIVLAIILVPFLKDIGTSISLLLSEFSLLILIYKQLLNIKIGDER